MSEIPSWIIWALHEGVETCITLHCVLHPSNSLRHINISSSINSKTQWKDVRWPSLFTTSKTLTVVGNLVCTSLGTSESFTYKYSYLSFFSVSLLVLLKDFLTREEPKHAVLARVFNLKYCVAQILCLYRHELDTP